MNSYFYKIWLPLHIALLISIVCVCMGIVTVNWWVVLITWFFIGPIGIGTGFHRLFSHRQFKTWRPVEIGLAILGTLSAYAPILFWIGQHQSHHRESDTHTDIQSPTVYGFWESFLTWRLRKGIENKINPRDFCTRQLMRDNTIMRIGNNTATILWCWAILLLIISPSLLIGLFLFPAFIESLRINLVNYYGHNNCIGSYRNFNTPDSSQNNLLIGWLGLGIGWHNNHHANYKELVNTHRWWEIDVEGYIGRLLSKPS